MEDLEEELEKILSKVHEWSVEFSKSKYFEKLTKKQKQEAEFVITTFAEYMYTYHELPPEEWNEEALEECCLYTLPRKITADISYFKSIAPVLSEFFTFLGEKNLLKNALKLRRKVKKIGKRIVSNAMDPRYWGLAKLFAMSLFAGRIDEEEIGDLLGEDRELLFNFNIPEEDETKSATRSRKRRRRGKKRSSK